MKRAVAIIAVLAAAVVALGVQGKSGSGYRVRAIFDTAAFVVPGEDVKVAGVRIGKIDKLSVTPDYKAAVEFTIEDPGYQDFRKDASCLIRPQSLIGEQFIECALTQPRGAGEPVAPELPEADDGAHLLPVDQTRTTVALDLIGNINRLPVRQRLTLILNELGAGLAGRGEDLNEVIRRAAPALEETDKVLELLADQNQVLKQLAVDSDRILDPLARERKSITSLVRESTTVAEATLEESDALAANFEKLPVFLAELRPTMDRLIELSDQGIPLATDLLSGAQDINELIARIGPFAEAGIPAVTRLGEVAEPGIPALRASLPIVRDLNAFGKQLKPVARELADVLTSLRRNDGIERALDYIYFQVQAINGFDNFGHFLRAGLIVNTCSTYSTTPASECLAKFASNTPVRSSRTPAPIGNALVDRTARVLAGEQPEDVLDEEGLARVKRKTQEALAVAEEPVAPRTSNDLMDFLLGSDR
jgi:phospholipid/cholesterol/gamma-HCH transport system substrate-binding protein